MNKDIRWMHRQGQEGLRGLWAQIALVVVASVAAATVGCAPQKPSDGDSRSLQVEEGQGGVDDSAVVLARINGEALTREEFNRRIEGLAPYARVRLQSPQRRREFLRSAVQFEVMADEAERRGLGDRPEVRHAMKEVMVRLLLVDRLREEVSMREIDDEAVQTYYEEHLGELKTAERRRVARLWVEDEERAQGYWERFEVEETGGVDAQGRGRLFQRFAFRHSQDRETGDQGGDLGWMQAGDENWRSEQAFAVEPGVLQSPREADEGWEIWMVVEVEAAHTPGLEEVAGELRTKIFEERRRQEREKLVAELMQAAEVEIFEDRIEAMEPPSEQLPAKLEELPRVESHNDENATRSEPR